MMFDAMGFRFCFFLLIISGVGLAQNPSFPEKEVLQSRIVFYNVENLFDTEDDTLKQDEEFLPGGMRGWNWYRLNNKLNKLYKTIVAVGGWDPPVLVGMAEVENRRVLERLIAQTPLHRFHYQLVHEESPDERGIDVAILYRADRFELLESQAWPVVFPFDPDNKTRDLLYAKGVLQGGDTLHVVVNHWPSRFGGVAASEIYRLAASRMLAEKMDSLLSVQPRANIIITGDFNDEPQDKSMLHLTQHTGSRLVNISTAMEPGTLKYEASWAIFDQFLVSENLLQDTGVLSVKDKTAKAFSTSWLLETDEKFLGLKPKRTYAGYQYHDGFSDHLPVYLDIIINKENAKKRGRQPFQ